MLPKALQPRPRSVERLPPWNYGVPVAVALVTLAVYSTTTARDITVGDNPEFVAAALTLGVGDPPGYPLAAILGHLFSFLPIGPEAFRVNLLAAVCGAAASGVIALTALKLTRNVAAAVVAGLALAADPLFWRWSLEAEAFPLNNIIVASMLFLLVSWHQRPQDTRWLVAAAFTGGLGMANHHTIVLCAPAVLFVLVRRFSYLLARPGALVACAAAVAAGMLPYLYIGWAAARDPFFNWGDIGQTKDLAGLFLRRDYGTGQLVAGPAEAGSPVDRLRALAASFTVIEGVLLTAGAVQAYRTHRWYFVFALLAFLPTGPAFAAYANIDVSQSITLFVLERFFLLPHVVVAPLAAFGVLGLAAAVRRLIPERITLSQPLDRGIAAVALVVIVAGAVATYPTVDLHNNHLARTYAEDVLASLPVARLLIEPLAVPDRFGDLIAESAKRYGVDGRVVHAL
ncbi:MAG: DUF2723 domain-containing protein, partial [Chloroflexota bacterium]